MVELDDRVHDPPELVLKGVEPVASLARNADGLNACLLDEALEILLRPLDIELVGHDDGGTLRKFHGILVDLAAQHLVVAPRLASVDSGHVDDVDENARTLEVLQERKAEPDALRRALNYPGHVRYADLRVVVVDDRADDRVERGERIARDLRSRGGKRRKKRRLAGVREAEKPDIGDSLELEPEPALLCGSTGSVLGRGLVHGRLKVDIPEATCAALGDNSGLPWFRYVGDKKPRVDVVDLGAERNGHDEVFAALAEHLLPLAGAAVLREALGIVE